mgnify:CR=1 FL=1
MSVLANFRPRVRESVVTLITRELSGQGQILAKVGQEVTPSDVLGQTLISAGFRVLDLSHELSVSPKEVGALLQKTKGQSIFRGEVLAMKPTFLGKKKPYLSPVDGILDSYDEKNGSLRVVYSPERHRMLSAVFGIIQRVDTKKGIVVIKTLATEILGIGGTGKIREGSLSIIGDRGSVTNLARIQPKFTDKIIVAGSLIYQDALRASVTIGIKGVVVGGIEASDFRSMSGGSLTKVRKFASDVGISLIVTEGFGGMPIGEDIFNTMIKWSDKFAVLDGNRARLVLPSFEEDSMQKVRSTALPISREDLVKPIIDPVVEELRKGQILRIVGGSYTGEEGRLFSIDSTPTLLLSGMSTYLLTIETSRKKIKIPLPNVEIIG